MFATITVFGNASMVVGLASFGLGGADPPTALIPAALPHRVKDQKAIDHCP